MNKQEQQQQQEQPGTLGFITGKSERSAIDFFERIETNFLEKYFLYLLMDEVGSDFFTPTDLDPQMISQGYTCTQQFSPDQFCQKMDDFLNQYNPPKKREKTILKIFTNHDQNKIQEDDFIFFYQKIKMTVQKLKELGKDLIKKMKREKELREYKNKTINVMIFYTGDVNFDFNKDQILSADEITMAINDISRTYKLNLSIYYISKVALFNHFAKANKLNIEYLDDKIITLFELKRLSLRRRQQALFKQKQEQKRKEERKRQNINDDEANGAIQRSQSLVSMQKKEKDKDIPADIIPGGQTVQLSKSSNEVVKNIQQNNSNLVHGSVDQIEDENVKNRKRNMSVGVSYGNSILGISVFLGLSVGVPFLIRKIINK